MSVAWLQGYFRVSLFLLPDPPSYSGTVIIGYGDNIAPIHEYLSDHETLLYTIFIYFKINHDPNFLLTQKFILSLKRLK